MTYEESIVVLKDIGFEEMYNTQALLVILFLV